MVCVKTNHTTISTYVQTTALFRWIFEKVTDSKALETQSCLQMHLFMLENTTLFVWAAQSQSWRRTKWRALRVQQRQNTKQNKPLKTPQDQTNYSFQRALRIDSYMLSVSPFRIHSHHCTVGINNSAAFKMRRQFKQRYPWLRALIHARAHTYKCHYNAALIQPCTERILLFPLL